MHSCELPCICCCCCWKRCACSWKANTFNCCMACRWLRICRSMNVARNGLASPTPGMWKNGLALLATLLVDCCGGLTISSLIKGLIPAVVDDSVVLSDVLQFTDCSLCVVAVSAAEAVDGRVCSDSAALGTLAPSCVALCGGVVSVVNSWLKFVSILVFNSWSVCGNNVIAGDFCVRLSPAAAFSAGWSSPADVASSDDDFWASSGFILDSIVFAWAINGFPKSDGCAC